MDHAPRPAPATPQRFSAPDFAINQRALLLRTPHGNVFWDCIALLDSRARNTAALETRIERHLHAALGYEVTTFIRTPAEIAAVAAHTPFDLPEPAAGSGALSAVFLKTAVDAEITRRVEQLTTDVDAFHLHGREVYWRCAVRQHETRMSGARLERALGGPATARNITTVRRLAALAPGPSQGYHS